MSTQHPDNSTPAPFAGEDGALRGEGEIAEAAHVFTEMGCDEQMWDYEGKGADVDVVLKLLQRNPEFFRNHPLGRDCRLTLRIPNPTEERELRKKMEEALHSITTAYDIATAFYGNTEPPIFEVILPFTTSAEQLVLVDSYYRQEVAGKGQHALPGGKKVASWLGDYLPESINVIPLVEDRAHLLEIDKLVERYLTMLDRKVDHLRVFVARSDPALMTGMVAATLLAKVALSKLAKLEQRMGVPIYPIIGVGGVPFRGNFRPHRVNRVLEEYPSVRTFTVQSSFKFDHPATEVQEAIERLKTASRGTAAPVDEPLVLDIINRSRTRYQRHLNRLAAFTNRIAGLIPQRRDRRLHTGLFGYGRTLGEDSSLVRLPRAIGFAAALYSVGVPPELLALEVLTPADWETLKVFYPSLEADLQDALRYANPANIQKLLGRQFMPLLERFGRDRDLEHEGLTSHILQRLEQDHDHRRTRQLIEWAAQTRGFLG